ncbi:MAG: hypothetical protein IJS40_05640 [Synergistaceae bacterium]|nr:hypothetical protein [Synergistaceae bacterium]
MKKQRREAKIFVTLCIAFFVLLIGSFYILLPKRGHNDRLIQHVGESNLRTVTFSQDSHTEEVKHEHFVPKYEIIETEDYTQKIYVPLWLSREILEQNLLHAAKNLKEKTNASKIIVWAYRQDDREHGVYTAGKCTFEEFPVFEWANVYNKDKSIYKNGSQAMITHDKTNLYKQRTVEPDEVIKTLGKGTKTTILDSYRIFSSDEILDIYKVQVSKKVSGWILGSDLIPILSEANQTKPKVVTNKNDKGFNRPLYNGTVRDWRKATERDKYSACEYIVKNAYKAGLLTINVNEYNINRYSKDLQNCINAWCNNITTSKQADDSVFDIAILSFLMLNWAK